MMSVCKRSKAHHGRILQWSIAVCVYFFRERVLEKEREEKWKKMEAMRKEREGEKRAGGEASSPTKPIPEQGQEGSVESTNSEEVEDVKEPGPSPKPDKASKDAGNNISPTVTESDT